MKPELIDDLGIENQAEYEVNVFKTKYRTWKYAKPLNYYYGILTRIKHAYYVLTGNAVAFRFFEDFSDAEKAEYIKNDIKRQSNQ